MTWYSREVSSYLIGHSRRPDAGILTTCRLKDTIIRVEIVANHVKLRIFGIGSDEFVHKVEKLPPDPPSSAAPVML